VRAREREDLVRFFRRVHKDSSCRINITNTPNADYPWRVMVDKDLVANLVADYIIQDLNYDNFKNKCHSTLPSHRCDQLMDVWARMREVEYIPRKKAKKPATGWTKLPEIVRVSVGPAVHESFWSIPKSPSTPPRKKAKKHTKRLKGGIS